MSTPPVGWPGLAGAGQYAAQQAAKKAAEAESTPPPLPCTLCKTKDLQIAAHVREASNFKDEIVTLKADMEALQGRLELMMPRTEETRQATDNELIKRLQEIDAMQHRNIEAAERRVCELTAYIRGKNMVVPPEGSVAPPRPTQSWDGMI